MANNLYIEEGLKFDTFSDIKLKVSKLWMIKVLPKNYKYIGEEEDERLMNILPCYLFNTAQDEAYLYKTENYFIISIYAISADLKISKIMGSTGVDLGCKLLDKNIPVRFRIPTEREIESYNSLKHLINI